MAELAPQERLQPSLLDRLTDEAPDQRQEGREQRVLSLRRLRECVLRDLVWLLNSSNLATLEDLEPYPQVARSVLNYGMPGLAGTTVSSLDPAQLERRLRQALWDFEPRILRESLRIRLSVDEGRMARNAVAFEIEGQLWAQPAPLPIHLRTDIDLEIGEVTVSDIGGGRSA
jgi:type VI secretion system protein ImpF